MAAVSAPFTVVSCFEEVLVLWLLASILQWHRGRLPEVVLSACAKSVANPILEWIFFGNRFRRSLHHLWISTQSFSESQSLWKPLQEIFAPPQDILAVFFWSFSESLWIASGDLGISSRYPRNLPIYNSFQNLWKSLQEIFASPQDILGMFQYIIYNSFPNLWESL